jgi:hypothetical protein
MSRRASWSQPIRTGWQAGSTSNIRKPWSFRKQSLTTCFQPFSNHKVQSRFQLGAEYYATLNQVRNFESPGTGLIHAN